MQPIHIKRFKQGDYIGSIEPEDRSWAVFIAKDGTATLWRRTELFDNPEGYEHGYLNVEDMAAATVAINHD